MPDDTITAARRQPGDAGDPAGYWSRWINPDGTPDGAKLAEIVRGIVSAVRPDRIVLFGSAARGAMKSGSDLDLLVVKNVSNLRELSLRVRDSLPVDRPPVDVLAATPELVEKHGDSLGWVLRPAVEEGTTIYEKSSGVETADGRGRRSRGNGDEETNRVMQPVVKSPLHSTGAASRLNCVVRRSHMADMLPPHALSAGRPARLGATRGFTTGCMVRTRRYKPEEALDWLRRAKGDLGVGRTADPEADPDTLCSLAQAAAEKALKGIVVARGARVEYTHEITTLAEQVRREGERLPGDLDRKKMDRLSEYGGDARYPGPARRTTRADCEDALGIAAALVEHAERRIPEILALRSPDRRAD